MSRLPIRPTAFAITLALTLAGTGAVGRAAPRTTTRPETSPSASSSPYFAIEVVDEATGRGVPLAELRTTNDVRYYTDSNGLVAYQEPGLMGTRVYFHVSSPGYEIKADGFGHRGLVLTPEAGKSAQIKLKRLNIAERLYRVTGQGIYADTLLLGRDAPTAEPALSGRVTGQDSVVTAVYGGKVYWFWGDTNRPDYPLGNFSTTGATSFLPNAGGLDPSRGVDLQYFMDETKPNGFTRAMVPLSKPGLVWVEGIAVVRDEKTRRDRMFGGFMRLKGLGAILERGVMEWDDDAEHFKQIQTVDLKSHTHPRGHALSVTVKGEPYIYFACPYPLVRVKAEWSAATNPAAYEAFTCLKPGGRYDKDKLPELDRDASGKLLYAWKCATDPIGPAEQQELIKHGKMKSDEAWLQLKDAETKEPVTAHAGSAAWNEFRKKFVMVFTQFGGKESLLGHVWYAEADAPEGPWKWAHKVASHPNYSFYNARHHPFFDQEGGRLIYFEGTYTAEFSGAPVKTPRYDYNQIMYRLDLADERLKMPE